jgi:hypothetical protein
MSLRAFAAAIFFLSFLRVNCLANTAAGSRSRRSVWGDEQGSPFAWPSSCARQWSHIGSPGPETGGEWNRRRLATNRGKASRSNPVS